MGSLESLWPLEGWWELKEVDAEDEEDVGFLLLLEAELLLVRAGLTEPTATPFFSKSWMEGVLGSSLVSCIKDTPAAPVAPETLVGPPRKFGLLAPTEEDVLVQGGLPSCLEDETLVPESNLFG